jgi:hypothetical protein
MRMWWQGMVMVLGGAMVRAEVYLTLVTGAEDAETETRVAGAGARAEGAAEGAVWVYFSLETTTSSRVSR